MSDGPKNTKGTLSLLFLSFLLKEKENLAQLTEFIYAHALARTIRRLGASAFLYFFFLCEAGWKLKSVRKLRGRGRKKNKQNKRRKTRRLPLVCIRYICILGVRMLSAWLRDRVELTLACVTYRGPVAQSPSKKLQSVSACPPTYVIRTRQLTVCSYLRVMLSFFFFFL